MNELPEKYIIIGKFGKPHGIKGWLKFYSSTKPLKKIMDYMPWYIKENTSWQEIEIDNIQAYGQAFLVHIKDINDPETASILTNKSISTKQNQLPKLKKNEYYWSDLEGLKVINKDNIELGTISHLFETGANDVMVVKNKKRHLIPYIPKQVVLKIDLEKQIMLVDWDPEF